MSAFEDFVQSELPKRGYLNTDVAQETVIIRRGPGPRQFDAVVLAEGQVLGKVAGVLAGVDVNDPGLGGSLRKAVLAVTTASSTWLIAHGLGSENVIVQTFDESKFVIIPNAIQIVDDDNVQITFNSPQAGTARVIFLD